MYKWCHKSRRNYTFVNLKATKISKRCVFILVTWPWRLPEEWPEACGNFTVVGAGTKHGFGIDPIRNPTIWLVESRNQVNQFAYRGRIPHTMHSEMYTGASSNNKVDITELTIFRGCNALSRSEKVTYLLSPRTILTLNVPLNFTRTHPTAI